GWAVLAAAPILLGALAVVSARPDAPPSMVLGAGTASCVAGGLALVAALLEDAGRRRSARAAALAAASVVAISLAFLVLASRRLEPRAVALDEPERADLARAELNGVLEAQPEGGGVAFSRE
ncbi:MAG TPA: hypothetical protein VIL20_17040, partial [Sandaracinaceae bacterium]